MKLSDERTLQCDGPDQSDGISMSRIRLRWPETRSFSYTSTRRSVAQRAFFRDLRAGRDGRIWVQLHGPSHAAPGTTDTTVFYQRWIEPNRWGVFEANGEIPRQGVLSRGRTAADDEGEPRLGNDRR